MFESARLPYDLSALVFLRIDDRPDAPPNSVPANEDPRAPRGVPYFGLDAGVAGIEAPEGAEFGDARASASALEGWEALPRLSPSVVPWPILQPPFTRHLAILCSSPNHQRSHLLDIRYLRLPRLYRRYGIHINLERAPLLKRVPGRWYSRKERCSSNVIAAVERNKRCTFIHWGFSAASVDQRLRKNCICGTTRMPSSS